MAQEIKLLRTVFAEPYSTQDYVDIICEAIRFASGEKFTEITNHYNTRQDEFFRIEDGNDVYIINDKIRSLYVCKDGKEDTVYISEIQYNEITCIFHILGGTPLIINITNTSKKTQKVSLFNAFTNMNVTNFCNPNEIQITSGSANVSYLQILQQTIVQPFVSSYIRVISTTNTNQYTQPMYVFSYNMHGQSVSQQIHDGNPSISPFGLPASIFDIIHSIKIDSLTEIKFNMLPAKGKNTITIYIYPKIAPVITVLPKVFKKVKI